MNESRADKTLRRNIGVYYACTVFTNVARTIPHAVLTVLLLSKGLSVPEIGRIQAVYNIAMVLSEFPSGVISDILSRKKVYALSLLVLIASYTLIIFAAGLAPIACAWFLYGVSSALDTGTLDAELINGIKKRKADSYLPRFMGRAQQAALIASVLGSGLGFVLYGKIGSGIYVVSVVLLVLSVFAVALRFKTEGTVRAAVRMTSTSVKNHIKDALTELKAIPVLAVLISLLSIMQIFFQTHYHFWQAACFERGISEKYFYVLYLAFQIIGIAAYRIKIAEFRLSRLLIHAFFSALALILLAFVKNNVLFLALYCFVCFEMTVLQFLSHFYFGKYVSLSYIGALTSLSSTVKRLTAFAVLLALSKAAAFIGLTYIFAAASAITLASVCAVYAAKSRLIFEGA
ncbi:MAG: MFS transporter [Treponema sp.]